MKKLKYIYILFSLITILTSCMKPILEEAEYDGIIYKRGFYGEELFALDDRIYVQGYKYELFFLDYQRYVIYEYDTYNLLFNYNSIDLLIAEDQFEDAKEYYSNDNNYIYLCKYGADYEDRQAEIIEIPNIDRKMYNELMEFANDNEYYPFGSDSEGNSDKQREKKVMPIPEDKEYTLKPIVFYKQTNDGVLTSYKGSKFHVVEDKLILAYVYDYNGSDSEKGSELTYVEVDEYLSDYFINFLIENNIIKQNN